jgi:hypothetical protein
MPITFSNPAIATAISWLSCEFARNVTAARNRAMRIQDPVYGTFH